MPNSFGKQSDTEKGICVFPFHVLTVGKRANSSLVLFFTKIKEKNSTGVPLPLRTMMHKKKTNSPNYRLVVQKITGDSVGS